MSTPTYTHRTEDGMLWRFEGQRPVSLLADITMVEAFTTRTYVISADGQSITCRNCGMTSGNHNDVEELYCGHCHAFHIEPEGSPSAADIDQVFAFLRRVKSPLVHHEE